MADDEAGPAPRAWGPTEFWVDRNPETGWRTIWGMRPALPGNDWGAVMAPAYLAPAFADELEAGGAWSADVLIGAATDIEFALDEAIEAGPPRRILGFWGRLWQAIEGMARMPWWV